MGLMDVKLRLTGNKKWDIDMDNVGRIKIAEGADKLALQVARSVMNQNVFSGFINTPVTNISAVNMRFHLDNLKRNLILLTNEISASFNGYMVYKSIDGINFERLFNFIIMKNFIDEEVENERVYFYGFSTVINNIEGEISNVVSVKPTRDSKRQRFYISANYFVQEGDGRILFFLKNKRFFSSAELLDRVINISVVNDKQDPRKFDIQVKVSNLAGSISDLTLNLGG